MKILYIGSDGDLSLQPLRYLVQSDHQVCAVAVDLHPALADLDPRFPVFTGDENAIETLARTSALPVINLFAPLEDVVAAITQLQPDLILVSCYARKLPQAILDIPVLGSFNLHPSLLPAYRGPVPVFWQFHDGVAEFGVTLHRMTEIMDAGDIVAQRTVMMPDGVTQERAHQLLAEAYVELLSAFLSAVSNGSLSTCEQNESEMSYQSFPTIDDFRLYTNWSAKRIFNFICATAHYGAVYPCAIAGIDYRLHSVLGYNEQQLPDQECVIDGDTIQIACNPGVLLARLARD
jgi:methionyl-tRNA formyltransferase